MMMNFEVITRLPASACENHSFAGHCTPECVHLVEMMQGDGYYESRVYTDYLGGESSVDWSGCHQGPLGPEEAVEFDVENRAVILVMVHPDGCQCSAHEEACGVSIVFGPAHDRYGAECEVVGEHNIRDGQRIHVQQGCPLSGDRDVQFRWLGGGTCAGDPLSFQILNDY